MSADGDNQEGRRHEPADPGMTVPDHVVHEAPSQRLWSQPVQVDATKGCASILDVVVAAKPEHQTSRSVEHRLKVSLQVSWQTDQDEVYVGVWLRVSFATL